MAAVIGLKEPSALMQSRITLDSQLTDPANSYYKIISSLTRRYEAETPNKYSVRLPKKIRGSVTQAGDIGETCEL